MSLNYDNCFLAAAAFITKKDFREKSNSECQWLQRNGLLDLACAHMIQIRRVLSDGDIASIAAQYTRRRAFKLGDQSAYKAAIKREILDRVCAHMPSDRYRVLTNEQIAQSAGRFMSRSDFVKFDNGAYQTATKRGILETVCAHMDSKGTRRLADEEILAISSKFNTRNDFKLGDFGAYTTAIRRGLIESACAHMEYGATGFREDKPAVLYQFRIETPSGLVLYKAGITNRKPKQRLTTMRIIQRGTKAELVSLISFDNGRDAKIAEKRLHLEFQSSRYNGPPIMKNGNTELFTVNVLDL